MPFLPTGPFGSTAGSLSDIYATVQCPFTGEELSACGHQAGCRDRPRLALRCAGNAQWRHVGPDIDMAKPRSCHRHVREVVDRSKIVENAHMTKIPPTTSTRHRGSFGATRHRTCPLRAGCMADDGVPQAAGSDEFGVYVERIGPRASSSTRPGPRTASEVLAELVAVHSAESRANERLRSARAHGLPCRREVDEEGVRSWGPSPAGVLRVHAGQMTHAPEAFSSVRRRRDGALPAQLHGAELRLQGHRSAWGMFDGDQLDPPVEHGVSSGVVGQFDGDGQSTSRSSAASMLRRCGCRRAGAAEVIKMYRKMIAYFGKHDKPPS